MCGAGGEVRERKGSMRQMEEKEGKKKRRGTREKDRGSEKVK